MKKCLFMVVVLMMTSISSANIVMPVKIKKDISEMFLYQKNSEENEDLDIKEFGCDVSCRAEVTYNGEHVRTFYATTSASNCIDAQTACIQNVSNQAHTFIQQVASLTAN